MNRKPKANTPAGSFEGYIGANAQKQIVKALVEDNQYFVNAYASIDQNMFSNPEHRQIVCTLKDIYQQHNRIPRWDEIELTYTSNTTMQDIRRQKLLDTIKDLKKDEWLVAQDAAKEAGMRLFRQKHFESILLDIEKKFQYQGYTDDLVAYTVEQFANVNHTIDNEEGNPAKLIEEVVNERDRVCVSTGNYKLDTAMNGGLPKKSVALFIAATGMGKSTTAAALTSGIASMDKKVLFITFEETRNEVLRKIYASLTGHYQRDFYADSQKLQYAITDLMNFEKQLNNIRVKRMANGQTTVGEIKNYINQLKNVEGFAADAVIIDYFGCIKKDSGQWKNEWTAGEMCMKAVEQMANDLNVAVWCFEQTNRMALKADTAKDRIANIQGSFRITQPCSFIFYLHRTAEDLKADRASIFMDKCRGCTPAAWENIYMSNGICRIDLDRTVEPTLPII